MASLGRSTDEEWINKVFLSLNHCETDRNLFPEKVSSPGGLRRPAGEGAAALQIRGRIRELDESPRSLDPSHAAASPHSC